jgi:lysophospholipase L1-like esterase
MRQNLRFNVTTDGCHPNRVGHNLVADALAEAVARALD